MYPNPVSNGKLYITSDSGADKTVAIYDILGKQVMATALTNDVVNVSTLNAGVYIVKVTEAGNTATRKLVIR
jgi:Secretion system C-terminal sorting domain